MFRQVVVTGAFAMLASCGTPEYRAEQSLCKTSWLNKIKPRFEQELYNRTETRQVPTGQTTCQTVGATTNCIQVMRTEYYTVPAVRTVDRNKPRRDAQIDLCTKNQCVAKFGNAECKVGG
ncbi:hypothetical protein OS189_03235 [Sulfitobacter sp. F26169L]|uniref:hypothetical protein n=1 Tax=Sulfitobacter sp. F26169L TaxID=2996015 RepID=UPI0022608700|nr:hypothetical protein [Sulfitobacter sp. F26169L]MCX7565357.1 hypothetical protein [Sulfitobacter sp. F26169L]